ncbi:MAG: hypothetical protein EBU54_17125 [Mycobacteriaceae bacterium]|nr:hypothetical protein [Mycobacteriaceae bacterium]
MLSMIQSETDSLRYFNRLLRQIASYLGHGSLDTTVIYTHLTAVSEDRALQAINALTRAATDPR